MVVYIVVVCITVVCNVLWLCILCMCVSPLCVMYCGCVFYATRAEGYSGTKNRES